MGRRGRISQEMRNNLVVLDGGFKRPDPPDDMTEVQKKIWRDVVRTEPAEFFDSTVLQMLLRSYCALMESVQAVQKEIDAFPMTYIRSKDDGRKYREMQAARALDLGKALEVATKLRLTNQSRYTPKSAATQSRNAVHDDKFPWEA
jgi:phage terminase small subunit